MLKKSWITWKTRERRPRRFVRRDSDWRLLKRRNVTLGQHMRPTLVRRACLAARHMLNYSVRRPDEAPGRISRLAQVSS